MGNNPKSLSESQFKNTQQTERLKKLSLQAQKFSRQRGLDQYTSSVIRCIFVHKRQQHLIQIIKKLNNTKLISQFVDRAYQANIQILDSFYEHIVKKSQYGQDKMYNEVILSPFDRQLGICGSSNLFKQHQLQPISQKYVQIIDLQKNTKKIPDYEKYKQKGLQAIKNKQVCFVILAGGRNIRYDMNRFKQCDPFQELPSKSSLIQIMLKKFEALGRLIETVLHLYIMVDSEDKKKKIKQIKNKKIPNPEFIDIDFIVQINYGCLDLEGKIVINDDDDIYFHPNGNGDIWANFQGINLEKVGFSRYKYIQLIGVSNLLQRCFDCYMIGKLVLQHRPWVTLCSEYIAEKDINTPFIYIDSDKNIRMTDPQQIDYEKDTHQHLSRQWRKAFLNNSVFSIQYVKQSVNCEKWLHYRKYHCKLKQIRNRPPLSSYKSIYTFQKQYTDIFALSHYYKLNSNKNSQQKKGVILLMNRSQYYSPFYVKLDQIRGVVQLSQLHKKWLKIQSEQTVQPYRTPRKGQKYRITQYEDQQYYEEKLKKICQIDPYISLQGQNLQQTIDQLQKITQQDRLLYPLYIRQQFTQESGQNRSTENSQRKFQQLNKMYKSYHF